MIEAIIDAPSDWMIKLTLDGVIKINDVTIYLENVKFYEDDKK